MKMETYVETLRPARPAVRRDWRAAARSHRCVAAAASSPHGALPLDVAVVGFATEAEAARRASIVNFRPARVDRNIPAGALPPRVAQTVGRNVS